MHSSAVVDCIAEVARPHPVAQMRPGSLQQVDARDFRAEIIALFESNGNRKFAEQFDWYYRDRGQETPMSWVLWDRRGEICGLCSVTPRTLRFGTTSIRAGVAGNLIMDRSGGAYLGAFSLVTAMKFLVDDHQIDILLGIPNELAEPVFSRLGFRMIDRWTTQTLICRSRELLGFHFGMPGRMASPFVDVWAAARRAFGHWREADSSGFRVIDLPESELDRLRPEDWPASWHRFAVGATSEYLKWRFCRDPVRDFSIAAIVDPKYYEVCGYVVLHRSPGRIWVTDCGVDHRQLSEAGAILCFCHDRRALDTTVWVTTLRSGLLSAQLRYCGFTRMGASMGGSPNLPLAAYWLPTHPLANAFAEPTSWNLLPGFNDV